MAYHLVPQPFRPLDGCSINVAIDMTSWEMYPFFFFNHIMYSVTNTAMTTITVNVCRPKEILKYSVLGLPLGDQNMKHLQGILEGYEELFHKLLDHVNHLEPHLVPDELLLKFTPPPILLPTVDITCELGGRAVRTVFQPRDINNDILTEDKNWLVAANGALGYFALVLYQQEQDQPYISWDEVDCGPTILLFLHSLNELTYHRPSSMLQLLRQRRREKVEVLKGLNNNISKSREWCHITRYNDRSSTRLDLYTVRKVYMRNGELLEPKIMQIKGLDIPYFDEVPEDAISITHAFGVSGRVSYTDKTLFDLLPSSGAELDGILEQRLHLQQRYPEWYSWLAFETNDVPPVTTKEVENDAERV